MKVLNELKVAIQSQNVQCQTLGLQYYNMIETMRTMSEKVDKLFDQFKSTRESIFDKIKELSLNFSAMSLTAEPRPITDSKLIERVDRLEENLTERINAMNEIIKARQDDLYDVYPENEEEFDSKIYGQSSCISNTFEDQNQLSVLNFSTSQLPFSSAVPFQELGLYNQTNQPTNPLPVFKMVPNPNVNITSSDTLPTGPPVSQPPLSVIIPTHHILGGSLPASEAQPSYPFKFNSQPSSNQSKSGTTHNAPFVGSRLEITVPGSNETLYFQSSLPTFKESIETSLNKSRNSATDDSYTEEHDPIPEFQPIIPLPDKIEEVTGEENDTVLFERRAKLYKYVEKEWKEKGLGIMKILKNNDTDKVRLVMRRDQVHKVCANHFLFDNMELKSKGDKAVIWSAHDFSDAVVQLENLCARFKSVEDCEEFTQVFNENKQPCSQNNSLVEDSYTSDNHNDSIIDVNKDACLKLTSENEKSLKHQLGGFTFSTPPIVNEVVTPKQQENTPEKPKGLFSNLTFSTPVGESGTPNLSSLLSKSNLSNSETTTDSNEKQSFSFDLSKSGFLSTENTPKSSFFSFNKNENKPVTFTPKLDLTSGTPATSYFSTLAKSSPNIGFTNSPDFKGFPGAGSTIFGTKVTNPSPHAIIKSPARDANNDSLNQPSEESEDFVPTAEFKPVIPLPEKVNVVTGEEGLEVVFEDRAKLLRYDSNSKEWKEKGIGQMKILHNSKEDYYQLLMRRELVFKICCNQRLSADLELKPVSSSEKAMSWIGQDFSEGENKKELFAIRFKTVPQLNAFRDKFNEVKNKVQDPKKIPSSTEDKSVKTTQSSVDSDASKTLPKLNELAQFKPKPGSWTCDACYLSNDSSTVKCVACCTVKPGAVIDQTTENKPTTSFTFGQPSFSSMFKFGNTTSNSQPAVPFVMPKFGTSSEVSFGSLSTSANANAFNTTNQTDVQKKPLTWREESAGLVKYDSDKSDDESDEATASDNESDGYDGRKSVVENEKSQEKFTNGQ